MDRSSSTSRTRAGWRFAALMILAGLLVGGAVGLGLGVRMAETYTARATVLVSPLDGNPFSPSGNGEDLVNLETEAQLVASTAVADVVAKDVGASDAGALLAGLQVDVPSNTQIVEITYHASRPIVAEQRAQGFATAYLALRVARADSVVAGRASAIQRQIDVQNTELRALQRRADATAAQAQRSILQEQIRGITRQVAKLRTALIGARTASADAGQVISPARVVSRDPQVTRWMFAAGGALAGLAAAALIIVGRNRSTGSSLSPDEPVTFDDPIQPVGRPGVQQPANA